LKASASACITSPCLPHHLSKLEDIQAEMDIGVALLLPDVLPFGIDILNLGLVLSRQANLRVLSSSHFRIIRLGELIALDTLRNVQ
jgi:hypothetical protein